MTPHEFITIAQRLPLSTIHAVLAAMRGGTRLADLVEPYCLSGKVVTALSSTTKLLTDPQPPKDILVDECLSHDVLSVLSPHFQNCASASFAPLRHLPDEVLLKVAVIENFRAFLTSDKALLHSLLAGTIRGGTGAQLPINMIFLNAKMQPKAPEVVRRNIKKIEDFLDQRARLGVKDYIDIEI